MQLGTKGVDKKSILIAFLVNSGSLLYALCSMPYAFSNGQSEIRNPKLSKCLLPCLLCELSAESPERLDLSSSTGPVEGLSASAA